MGCRVGEATASGTPKPLPEFTHQRPEDWVNGAPLQIRSLRGQVVLVDVWTFACWNCYRSFPWLNAVEKKFHDRGLRVVGVHAPEFDHEKPRKRVEEKVREFGLTHRVMIDADHSYWHALGNRYWPTFYLIDRATRIRAAVVGETHTGDERAQSIEKTLVALLNEPAPKT
jgi:glutathione peroxidase-family protein